MHIPTSKKDIGPWANEIVKACQPDLAERIQRGALYRNLYLTGDENGVPQTYPKTFEYIESLTAMFFSSLDLNYSVTMGAGTTTDVAVGRKVASDLHAEMDDAGAYLTVEEAVRWSLVKGLTCVKLLWERRGFAPYMVQPEYMGVLRPDLAELSRQPAFVHSSYYTPGQFESAFANLPDIDNIMRDIVRKGQMGKPEERPDRNNALKQIVMGGLNPFQAAGNSPAAASSRGMTQWLSGPVPSLDPKVMAELIRLDELWYKDTRTDDWATFQVVGDVLVTGGDVIRNAFADMFDPDNRAKTLPDAFRKNNPLSYQHPFIEFSANNLEGYFWGRSECCNVGILQMAINARINGINRLLRRQENPPKLMTGSTGLTAQKYSTIDKPGGFYADPTPNVKLEPLYGEMPPALWESLHELERIFDEMGGRPPVMRGMGDPGVRSQGHAETLTANASPRFKHAALKIEKSVSRLAQLSVSMMRAKDNRTMVAWLPPGNSNVVAALPPDIPELEAPAEGMKQFPFRYTQLPADLKAKVDSHSSSPIFSREARQLIFDLFKIGAVDAADVVEHVHPDGEEQILAGIQRRDIGKQAMLESLPPDQRVKLLAKGR